MENLKEKELLELKEVFQEEVKVLSFQLAKLDSFAIALLVINIFAVLFLSVVFLSRIVQGDSFSHSLLSITALVFFLCNFISILLFIIVISKGSVPQSNHYKKIKDIKGDIDKDNSIKFFETIISFQAMKIEELSEKSRKKRIIFKLGCFITGFSICLYSIIITFVFFNF
jgi:hypothetical protein